MDDKFSPDDHCSFSLDFSKSVVVSSSGISSSISSSAVIVVPVFLCLYSRFRQD